MKQLRILLERKKKQNKSQRDGKWEENKTKI